MDDARAISTPGRSILPTAEASEFPCAFRQFIIAMSSPLQGARQPGSIPCLVHSNRHELRRRIPTDSHSLRAASPVWVLETPVPPLLLLNTELDLMPAAQLDDMAAQLAAHRATNFRARCLREEGHSFQYWPLVKNDVLAPDGRSTAGKSALCQFVRAGRENGPRNAAVRSGWLCAGWGHPAGDKTVP